jgi:hypothetical protein
MEKRKMMAAVVIVIAAFSIIPRIGKSTDIEQRGEELSISIGKHRLIANINGGEIQDSFLIIGQGLRHGDLYFTALLSVIPLNVTEQLNRTYGDFHKCASPGASEAQRSVKTMILYAANHNVEQKLKSIDKLTLAGKSPVIQITYMELKITSHTIKMSGEEIQVTSRDNTPSFLVKDVQLIKKDRFS